MKTKNMRKKALLSSVAMLLVAVVALSGATYAWFTANNSAKVSPISLSTNKASNLLVSATENGTYASALTVDWNEPLVPMSCQTPGTFFTVTADTTKPITSTEADTYVSSITSATEGWLSETIYVKSGVACKLNLSSTTGGAALAAALRIAVTVGGSTVIYAPGVTSNTTQTSIKGTGVGANVQYSDLYAGNATTAGTSTATGVDFGSYTIAALGTDINTQINANTATEVSILIWLEGNDGDCENALSGVSLNDLALTFGSTAITTSA